MRRNRTFTYRPVLSFVTLVLSLTLISCNTATVENADKKSNSGYNSGNASNDISTKESNSGAKDVKIINKNNIEAETPYNLKVMINGKVYEYTGLVNSGVKCGTPDGEITSSVDRSKSPTKDDESNFGKGYEYQIWDKNNISIQLKGKWMFFRDSKSNSLEMPEGVATFTGKVLEVSDNRMLVEIANIPREFKHIFKNNSKPVALHVENMVIDNEKEITEEKFKDKLIQVWFNGEIKNDEPEMSYPMELGEIYSVSLVKTEEKNS